MSKLSILQLPHPILKQVCKQIKFPLDEQTEQNIRNAKLAFRESFLQKKTRTLGLAAPQVGALQRFFLMPKNINFGQVNLNLLKSVVRSFNVYINPKIISSSQVKVMIPQNCLSMGTQTYKVFRSQSIKVEYYNTYGQKIEDSLTGIRARVFLHQNDHLDGVTMDQKGELMSEEDLMLYRSGIKVNSFSKGNLNQQTH